VAHHPPPGPAREASPSGPKALRSPRGPQAQSQGPAGGADAQDDWAALRRGVRNARGDMVYFDWSFLEDPWAGLEAKQFDGGGGRHVGA
jgi:hypothetical protein